MQRETCHDAQPQQSAELVAAPQGDHEPVANHQRIEGQEAAAAEKAELLSQGREDEVGVLFRQKAQMALAAIEKTSAQKATRTQGDFRLQNVITGAERVAPRIEKSVDPVLLVVAKKMP